MSDLDARLAAIWERSRSTTRERLEAVERAAAAQDAGTLDEGTRQAGLRAAHQLAGSLGTFGLGEGSDLAREIEDRLDAGAPGATALSARLRELLEPRLG